MLLGDRLWCCGLPLFGENQRALFTQAIHLFFQQQHFIINDSQVHWFVGMFAVRLEKIVIMLGSAISQFVAHRFGKGPEPGDGPEQATEGQR